MKKTIITMFAALLLLCSCSSSQKALKDLRNLSEDINTEGSTYGVLDWKKAAVKFYKTDKKIVKYAARDKYSSSEMAEIGQLQADCATGFAKGVGENLGGKILNAGSFIKGFLDRLQ